MKPIIVDMKDMSDSTEVYESKANPFIVYTIYTILLLLLVALAWLYFSKMEIVVKGEGIFRCDAPVCEVGSGVSGELESCNVKNGDYVEAGDVLFSVKVASLNETIQSYQNELNNINLRLAILEAYDKSLDGDDSLLDAAKDNPYYQEFVNKKKLLEANIDASSENVQGKRTVYAENAESIEESIKEYKEKKEKLEKVKKCISKRKNNFDEKDNYYSSMVSSYISNYQLTESQYDTQIAEYKKQIEEYEELIKVQENEQEATASEDISNLKKSKESLESKLKTAQDEKNQTLLNLETQQLASIEQQIESVKETIASLESNLSSANLQLQSMKESGNAENISMLTEKENIAAEILSYKSKQEECQNYLDSYKIQEDQCTIVANTAGYFYFEQDVKKGSYLQEGNSIGKIYPKETKEYYAEVYIENEEIAGLKEGQEVNFEIPAYPSSEYGYFTGRIQNISKDIQLDETTGKTYYLVRAVCDDTSVMDKEGKYGTIINGMACQAKIIVDNESVLVHLLKEIELWD